ncbi:25149_t:CDS:2 [Racocetra persica]|uniref:25149_t:CDS:1 n=1 Tax=Racocetra persica TaxID=160502 RepID=A0ACA9KIA5_9GLOM|nr:25149_t:CDS:2 [Racocetra persica]
MLTIHHHATNNIVSGNFEDIFKFTNKEMQPMNEKTQSTNKEAQLMNKEAQSTNKKAQYK